MKAFLFNNIITNVSLTAMALIFRITGLFLSGKSFQCKCKEIL